jgi:hypothetical protein
LAEPSSKQVLAPHEERLRQHIEEMWQEHDRFIAEGGDPEAEIDRLAEELFGSEEATAVLLEYLQWTREGRRWAWLDGDSDDAE